MPGPDPLQTLAGVGEEELLARIFPHLPGGPGVILGPGDDTALVAAPGRSVLATTDAMVRQRDWRDEWSSGADVGAKVVAQNCADIASMGGVPTGLLVTLVAEPATTLAWVEDFAAGLGEAARAAGVPVVGGDLSSAPEGTLVVSATALGDLEGREPVLRSGARAGDVVAVAGSLGRSGAGWMLPEAGLTAEILAAKITELARAPAMLSDAAAKAAALGRPRAAMALADLVETVGGLKPAS